MSLESSVSEMPADYRQDSIGIPTNSASIMSPLLIGFAAVLISLGGLVLWSCLATIAAAVIVPGTVVVDSGRKYIQHIAGGIVASIDTFDGQDVKAGRVLIRFDSAALEIAHGSLEHLLAMNIGAQFRLRAEEDSLGQIMFPKEVPDLDSEIWLQVERDQDKLFRSRQMSLSYRSDTLKSDGAEAMLVAESVDEQMKAQCIRIALTEKELATAENLAQSGYDTRHHVLEISRSLAEFQIELASLHSRELDARQNAEHDRLEAMQIKAAFSESAAVDLQQMQKEFADLSLKIKAIGQQIAALQVRAPVSGRVVNLAVHTIGGVVGAGATILELVPENDPLVLEAEIRPEDIENVAVGLPVDVRLAGLSGQTLPRLEGTVTRVSADRVEDPARGTVFFRVRAEVGYEGLTKIRNHELKPGMVVTLMIKKGQQTPVEYLLAPLTKFFTRALK